MTTLAEDDFGQWDIGLDGVGYLLAWEEVENPYPIDAPDLVHEKTDPSEDLGQNRLDLLFWGSNRSWHEGSDQRRLNMPEASSPYRFWSSKGIDIETIGEAKLLHRCSRILALTNADPISPYMVATDQYIYVAAAPPNLKRLGPALDGSDVATVSHAGGSAAADRVYGLATDGTVVYVALSTHGIHRSVAPGDAAVEAFDSGAWTDTNVVSSADTADKKEGTGSRKLATTATVEGDAEKTFGAVDASAVDTFTIWIKASRATTAGEVKIRLITTTGNYYERSVPALSANSWTKDTSNRLTDWTAVGSPSWASITKVDVRVPPIVQPAFVAAATAQRGEITQGPPPLHNYLTQVAPAGVAAGDLLIWTVATKDGFSPGAFPSGWTLIRTEDTGDGTGHVRLDTYWRLAQSGDPGSWQLDANVTSRSVMVAYRGVDQTTPIDVSAGGTATSATITAPTLTPTTARDRLVAIFAAVNPTGGFPAAAGMTERAEWSNSTEVGISLDDEALTSASATGTRTVTLANSSRNAGQMVAIKPAGTDTYRFDDLRAQTTAAFAHWSDMDARVIAWAKDRLFAAGVKSGSAPNEIWRFSSAAALATSQEIFPLPEGWAVSAMAELQGFVYFAAYRNNRGVIYAYDGANAPFVALRFDEGDVPLSLIPFAGVGMLIGCRRSTPTLSGGLGILYRAFPNATGHLAAEKVASLGTDDGKDYGIRFGYAVVEKVLWGWSHADSVSAGLGIYYPENAAWTRFQHADVTGLAVSGLTYKGRHVIAVDGDGVWIEQPTYVAQGEIVSSIIDANVSADKAWLAREIEYELASGTKLRQEYSIDGGVSWLGADETTTGSRKRLSLNAKSPRIQYRITPFADGALANTPKLFFAGIGGWPADKPHAEHAPIIRAYPGEMYLTGRRNSIPANGYDVLARLLALRDAGTGVEYQPPWWLDSGQATKTVRVARVRTLGVWTKGTDGHVGGLIQLFLREVG